jgi:uncharacterized protein YcnI
MGKFLPQERAVAIEAGLTTFFTGRPCKHGHVTMRCTSSGSCIECAKASQKRTAKKRFEKNPMFYKEVYAKNAEILKNKAADYRAKNPEKVKASNHAWRKNNKHKKAAIQMQRHAAKLQATPKWLSKNDFELVDNYYKDASCFRNVFKVSVAVDHIVPLKSKQVCGLHVPWNLCLRTKTDNSKKKNKITNDVYWPKQIGVLVAESALPWNLRKEIKNDNLANC